MKETRVCPKCGGEYTGYPAISRLDNETQICPDCGVREALHDAFAYLKEEEIDEIIRIGHEAERALSEGVITD